MVLAAWHGSDAVPALHQSLQGIVSLHELKWRVIERELAGCHYARNRFREFPLQ